VRYLQGNTHDSVSRDDSLFDRVNAALNLPPRAAGAAAVDVEAIKKIQEARWVQIKANAAAAAEAATAAEDTTK
jgi:hypothetical protein